jgi:hypothetical protein
VAATVLSSEQMELYIQVRAFESPEVPQALVAAQAALADGGAVEDCAREAFVAESSPGYTDVDFDEGDEVAVGENVDAAAIDITATSRSRAVQITGHTFAVDRFLVGATVASDLSEADRDLVEAVLQQVVQRLLSE